MPRFREMVFVMALGMGAFILAVMVLKALIALVVEIF